MSQSEQRPSCFEQRSAHWMASSCSHRYIQPADNKTTIEEGDPESDTWAAELSQFTTKRTKQK